jgi:diaminopimelate decarboxylase
MNISEMWKAISQYKTPFYIFDTDILANQIKKIRTVLGSDVELCYAMKANPFVIKELQDIVDYFEVCSPGEFHICELADIDVNKIVMSGVYKNSIDIEAMLYEYGSDIIYTIESVSQWQHVADFALNRQRHVRVLLRLTTGNQFGMDETVIRQIISNRNDNPYIDIEGIQFFSGTQKKTAAKFEKELEMLDNLCSDLQKQYAFIVKKLEYGPGLPICYFEDDNNIEDFMLYSLAELIQKLKFKGKITLEMGRFIAASCGFYVTSVVDVKINNGQHYCIVDGGIHHINYLGQVMGMKKPPIIHWNEKSGEPKEWIVCGSLCTANDVLAKQYPFVDISMGDTLIFRKVGAYSLTEGISLFLSRELPQVLVYSEKDKFRLARSSYPTYILNY